MHVKTVRVALALVSTAIALSLTSGFSAAAHEEVSLGPVDFEIGFQNEPVYSGFLNAVFLSIHDSSGQPVTDAANTLKVEVRYGSQSMDVPLEPNFFEEEGGAPGEYLAHFIPTRPGKYTFHLSGTIGGQKIDRSFTSSPTTFDEVQDPTSVEFPAKDPTVGQLAERVEREFPRIEQSVTEAKQSLNDDLDSAKLIGIIGVAVGGVGLIIAIVALATRRRSAP